MNRAIVIGGGHHHNSLGFIETLGKGNTRDY